MCNDSSIVFTQKCSHLYSNLELFLFCLYFFSCIASQLFRTNQHKTDSHSARRSKRLVSIPV